MCPRGYSAEPAAANLEFYSGRGISFVKQGPSSTTNRNYSQPYVHDVRRPDVHTIPATGRIPFLRIILPLSLICHCFGWATLYPGT